MRVTSGTSSLSLSFFLHLHWHSMGVHPCSKDLAWVCSTIFLVGWHPELGQYPVEVTREPPCLCLLKAGPVAGGVDKACLEVGGAQGPGIERSGMGNRGLGGG